MKTVNSHNNLNFYKVTVKCGHVGNRRYIPIHFPVKAETASEAALIAREIPRVKRHNKKAVLNVEKVSYEGYCELKKINSVDPYLKVTNKRMQKQVMDYINFRICEEDMQGSKNKNTFSKKALYMGKQKIRKVSKFKSMFYNDKIFYSM